MAMRNSPSAYQFASTRLKDDIRLALVAVEKDGMCLRSVSERLKYGNKEIILKAVVNNGLSLQYAPIHWRTDNEVIKVAISQNYYALQYVPKKYRNNPGINEI